MGKYDDAQFLFGLIRELITEDPTKFQEAIEDAASMKEQGADFGASREELMAEYLIWALKTFNGHIPELVKALEVNESAVENLLIDYIRTNNL